MNTVGGSGLKWQGGFSVCIPFLFVYCFSSLLLIHPFPSNEKKRTERFLSVHRKHYFNREGVLVLEGYDANEDE